MQSAEKLFSDIIFTDGVLERQVEFVLTLDSLLAHFIRVLRTGVDVTTLAPDVHCSAGGAH